jgi:predicted MPP superfamily phosphohydrolase
MNSPKGILFVGLFLIVSAPAQLYLFGALRTYVRKRLDDVKRSRRAITLSAWFFVVMLFPLAWRAFFGLYAAQPNSSLVRGVLTISTIWWAGCFGCAIVLFGYSLFCRLILFSKRETKAARPDPGRRDFLRNGARMAVTAPFLISGYGTLIERRHFELDHFDIGVTGLSSSLSQLTIAQLTDIHVGPFMPAEELAEYVEAVNRLQPDLIALTGDFVTSSPDEVAPCVETLAGLKGRYGVFACMGNHDIYAGAANKLTSLFGAKGIQTLRNDAVTIHAGSSRITVVGIDDPSQGHADLRRALTAAQKDPGEVNILLSHRPEYFPAAAQAGMDLVLSGHYHGGQIKLLPEPGALSIARLITPYAEGLFRLPRTTNPSQINKDANLFVSRGVGITGLPIRINCPPQIAHLRLKSA